MRNEIKRASPSARAILESIYAEVLNDIYRLNQYSINNRTDINVNANDDFTTWSAKNFKDKIAEAYARSVKNRDILYKVPLKNYEAIITFNTFLANTNRSLYDFLAERYINADIDGYGYITDAEIAFQSPALFGNTEAFSKFKTVDNLPPGFKGQIALCRDVEQFYTDKKDNYSLQRSILRRLEFANEGVSIQNKDTILTATLSQLITEWGKSPFAYRAMLQQAVLLSSNADKITAPDNYKKAIALYDNIIANAALNDVAAEAQNGKNDIAATKISLRTDKYVAPNSPILALVGFKGIEAVTVRVYKLSHAQAAKGKNQNEYLAYTDSVNPFISKTYALPKKDDYFEYTTEVVLPSLQKGYYLIAAARAGAKTSDERDYTFDIIQATDLAVTEQSNNNKTNYQVTNRTTGKPVANAKAVVENKLYTSGKNGLIAIAGTEKAENRKIIITHEADTLGYSFYSHKYYGNSNDEEDFTAEASLYLDRAIYRPGQTLYFKAIITQNKNGVFSTVPNTFFSVSIRNTQYKTIKEFRLKTNDFGSLTGEYTIPKDVLTGDFNLEIEEDDEYEHAKRNNPFWDNVDFKNSNIHFKVEDYKRPTFEVVFNPVKNDIRINEKATVSGNAKAFSGANLNNAKVVYRITRNARMTTYMRYNNSNADEIANGEVITDTNGKFTIDFIALPDTAFSKDGLPVFTYTVYATVTDANGETHSSEKSVFGGYHSLVLTVNAPQVIIAEKGGTITFKSENLNAEARPVQGEITIYKIADVTRTTIRRPWQEPEIQIIPQKEFERLFPYLPYKNVVNDTVIRLNNVFTKKVNTASEKSIAFTDLKKWLPGNYQIVFTAKDSVNTTVENTALFTLKNEADIQLPNGRVFAFEVKNKNYKKDGFIKVELQSRVPVLYINVLSGIKSTTIFDEVVTLKDGRATIKIPVTKKTSGTVVTSFDFIWQNQYYTENLEADLTETQKSLEIEAQTITNKLLRAAAKHGLLPLKTVTKPLPKCLLLCMIHH